MLTILTGPDRVFLTDELMGRISQCAKRGQSGQVLIVPEQFSHEAERRLCTDCGDTISRFAEVLSFSRLWDRLAACHGGVARAYLDKGGQLLSMASAAEQTASRLKHFASVLRKPEFLSDLVRMTTEFQSYCLTPQDLLEASRQEDGLFALKLQELGLMYEGYLAVCANGKADPSDKMVHLTDTLLEGNWACSRSFYLDGFSDFTGAELAAVEALLLHGREITVALCCGEPGSCMERLCRDTVQSLLLAANKHEIQASVVPLTGHQTREPAVQRFLEELFVSSPPCPASAGGVSLPVYRSMEEECRGTAKNIRAMIAQGIRCRDIAVACTDLAAYKVPLAAAFREAQIPVYIAGEEELLHKPLIASIVNSVFAAAGPMEYDDVVLYLKSGLPEAQRDRCDRLDQYAYLWNIRGTQWERPWEFHPRGFAEGWSDRDRENLSQLNTDREEILEPLILLRKGLLNASNTGHMVQAVYQFLEQLHLRQRLEEQANEFAARGDGKTAQELVQLYEILCISLEQLWWTLEKTVRTPEEFSHLFQSLLTQYQVSTIPAGLDQVQISEIVDLRYKTTKHLFVLGASDGRFPAYETSEGLLTELERQKLLDHGLRIAPGRAEQMDQQMGRIYNALLSATMSLTMSYAGEQPAWLFRRASELFPDAVSQIDQEVFLQMEDLAAWRLRSGKQEPTRMPDLDAAQQDLQRRRAYGFTNLDRQTVHALYGAPLQLSASKIDTFSSCQLAYFLRYGMKAQPRKQAKMDQPAYGTFVHYVLEHTVERVMKQGGFETVEEQAVLDIAAEEIRIYAREYLPQQQRRDAVLFQRSQEEIRAVVSDLWQELRVSKFRPAFCELKFAPNGALPAITIQGKTTDCQIIGLVDRVDLFQEQGKTYVRIVDYKTGRKDFDYTDVLNGTGLQMLIYLFALRAFGKDYLGTQPLEPAGVLYLPAKTQFPLTEPMPSEDAVAQEHRLLRKRKGLIRKDENILAAMELDPSQPQFMPYHQGRSGLTGDLADRTQMTLLERHVIRTVADLADTMAAGAVTPDPMVRGDNTPCRYCDYQTVCHKDLGLRQPREQAKTGAEEFWQILQRQEENHG